jgi:hypothetical protein
MKAPETFEEMVNTARSIDPVANGFTEDYVELQQADTYMTMSSDVGVEGPESDYEATSIAYHLAALWYMSEPREVNIWTIETWARKRAEEEDAPEEEGADEKDRISHTHCSVAKWILAHALGDKRNMDNYETW